MKKLKALSIFNALSLLIHIGVAYLVQAKMVNDLNVGEVSAKYESLFTPAGITFAIWGLIYISLLIMCLYHIVIAYKHDSPHPANTELLRIGSMFILVNIASAAWLIAWVNEYLPATVLLIVIQLLGLLIINRRLNIYDPLKPTGLKLTTQFALSIYFAWICVATIANIATYLTAIQWDGFGQPALQWAAIMICTTILIAVLMILIRKNVLFGLVVAWALYGITVKRQSLNTDSYEPLTVIAWCGIGLLIPLCIFQLIRNINYKKPKAIFPSYPAPVK